MQLMIRETGPNGVKMHGPYGNKASRDRALIRIALKCDDLERTDGVYRSVSYFTADGTEGDGKEYLYEICVAEVHHSYRQTKAKTKEEALRNFNDGDYKEIQCEYERELEEDVLCVKDIEFIE